MVSAVFGVGSGNDVLIILVDQLLLFLCCLACLFDSSVVWGAIDRKEVVE